LYKVNVDDYPNLAERYNILSIPTLLCFKNGNLVGRITGAMPKQRLYSKLKEIFEL
jgi:thioredoxin 1